MNKKALIALVAFAGLLGVVFWLERKPAETEAQSFEIPGFVESANQVVKTTTELKTTGFDKIELTRKGEEMTFTVVDGKWRMSKPRDSAVDENKLKSILLPHQRPLRSIFSTEAKEGVLGDYGLAADNGIRVAIYRNGGVFASYVVGAAEKSDDPEAGPDDVDTWIRPASGEHVFRIAGADLRRAVDFSANDFRDKAVLPIERNDIAKIEIENPENTKHRRIVLDNATPPPEPKPEGDAAKGEDGKDGADEKKADEKKTDEKWVISEPQGFEVGTGISGLLSAVTGLRAMEFLASTEGVDTGLAGDTVAKVRVTTRAGKVHTLLLGKTADDKLYAQLEGTDEVFTLSKYSAQSLKKTVNDLRNKSPLGIKAPAITAVRFGAVQLVRNGADWTIAQPTGFKPGTTQVDGLLRDIETWTVTDFIESTDLAAHGLAPENNPQRIVIEHTGGTTTVLLSDAREQVHYAVVEGSTAGEIWKLTEFMGKKLHNKTVDDFRNRQLFAFKRDNVDKVEIIHPDETLVLERQKDATEEDAKWKLTRGTESNPKPAATIVSTLLATLETIQAKGFETTAAADAGISDKSAVRLVVTEAGGARHELVISAKKKEEDPYAAAPSEADWGQQVVVLNKYQADNLTKKYTDFSK
jgi:hypothetical protein